MYMFRTLRYASTSGRLLTAGPHVLLARDHVTSSMIVAIQIIIKIYFDNSYLLNSKLSTNHFIINYSSHFLYYFKFYFPI